MNQKKALNNYFKTNKYVNKNYLEQTDLLNLNFKF